MVLNPGKKEIDSWEYEDFKVENYQAHPHIKGDIAI
jgi:thymidylate synthase